MDHPQIEQGFLQFLTRLFKLLIHFKVRAHGDGAGRGPGIFGIVVFHALLGHHAVGRKACEHIGHRLRQFAVHGH